MRQLGLLLVLAATVLAQEEKGPAGPRQLFLRFQRFAAEAAAGDDQALGRAGQLFVLDDVNRADRDAIGRRAAADLYNFLNRIEPAEGSSIPLLASAPWVYQAGERGSIEGEKVADGSWRFSAKTRHEIAELLEKVRDRAAQAGRRDITTSGTWLRDLMPAWLRNRVFLLANWQWVGLLMLVILGIIAGQIGAFLFFRIALRLARARGAELRRGRKAGRPFGLMAMAAFWWLGLDWLLLPERAHIVMILVVRLLLMVGAVWSLMRIVDWISEVFVGLAQRTESKFDDLLVPMVRRAVKVFVTALGIVWIADNLDMDIGALLAGLGIGGIALALAAKDTVSNFFGALTVLTDRPFEVGDWVVIGTMEGTVSAVGFRSTRIVTFYNSVVTFPNSILITTPVDNLGRRSYRRFKTHLGVTYDTPADKLETFIEGIRELIRRHPYTRKDYYHVYLNRYGANSLDILVYMFFTAPDWATELRERQRLLMDILRLAEELGVDFAFPTRTLHMVQATMPDHGEPAEDIRQAWKKGQAAAGEIVEEFTGSHRPPPVSIGTRPDEALEEGE